MLGYYTNDLVQRLNTKREEEGWQVGKFTSNVRGHLILKWVSIGSRGNFTLSHVHSRSYRSIRNLTSPSSLIRARNSRSITTNWSIQSQENHVGCYRYVPKTFPNPPAFFHHNPPHRRILILVCGFANPIQSTFILNNTSNANTDHCTYQSSLLPRTPSTIFPIAVFAASPSTTNTSSDTTLGRPLVRSECITESGSLPPGRCRIEELV